MEKGIRIKLLLRGTLLFVGVHSLLLGSTIYFFTTPFYQFFFGVDPENFFFVKQAGLFLSLMGLFYLLPVFNLERFKPVIFLIVFSKVVAVTFLILNAHLTPSAFMIYLAALGDGTMAAALTILLLIRTKFTEKGA